MPPNEFQEQEPFSPVSYLYSDVIEIHARQSQFQSIRVLRHPFFGAILVLDNIVPESSKTSEFSGLLKNLNINEKKLTILTSIIDDNLYFGSRNIKNICVVPAQSASTYDLLDCQLILADVASVEILNNQLSN